MNVAGTLEEAVGLVRWQGSEFAVGGDSGGIVFAVKDSGEGAVHIPIGLHLRSSSGLQISEFILLSVFVGFAEEVLDGDLQFIHA